MRGGPRERLAFGTRPANTKRVPAVNRDTGHRFHRLPSARPSPPSPSVAHPATGPRVPWARGTRRAQSPAAPRRRQTRSRRRQAPALGTRRTETAAGGPAVARPVELGRRVLGVAFWQVSKLFRIEPQALGVRQGVPGRNRGVLGDAGTLDFTTTQVVDQRKRIARCRRRGIRDSVSPIAAAHNGRVLRAWWGRAGLFESLRPFVEVLINLWIKIVEKSH